MGKPEKGKKKKQKLDLDKIYGFNKIWCNN